MFACDWSAKIYFGNPSDLEAWQTLHVNTSAKLRYTLPVCILTKKECTSIMFPALKSSLPKSGIIFEIPTAIRDGSFDNDGA